MKRKPSKGPLPHLDHHAPGRNRQLVLAQRRVAEQRAVARPDPVLPLRHRQVAERRVDAQVPEDGERVAVPAEQRVLPLLPRLGRDHVQIDPLFGVREAVPVDAEQVSVGDDGGRSPVAGDGRRRVAPLVSEVAGEQWQQRQEKQQQPAAQGGCRCNGQPSHHDGGLGWVEPSSGHPWEGVSNHHRCTILAAQQHQRQRTLQGGIGRRFTGSKCHRGPSTTPSTSLTL